MSGFSPASVPTLRPHEVRVRVAARVDIPHAAAAGVVVETAAGAAHRAGTRVACIAGGAGRSGSLVAPEQSVFALPDALDDASAAALLASWPAAWFALHQRAHLRAGECLLVLDAASAIGIACIQLAKAAGARVVALTRLRSEFDAVRHAGADDVVSQQESLWPDIVREHGGAEVIAGAASTDVLARSMRALVRGGRLLAMMPPETFTTALPLGPLLLRGGALLGAFWSDDDQRRTAGPIVSALLARWAEGGVRLPPIQPGIDPAHPLTPGISRT